MSKKSVFCITTSRGQADRIVEQLKAANFSNNDISVLFPDKGTSRDFAHEKNTKAPEGAAIGAAAGGIAGGLIGLGIPELEAKRYEGKVKDGNILLSVHTENSEEIKRAKDIFKNAQAEDICTTGEATAPDAAKFAKNAEYVTYQDRGVLVAGN